MYLGKCDFYKKDSVMTSKMSKLLLAMLLTIVSTLAMAEWTAIGGENDITFYVDKTSISKKGDMAKILKLHDFKSTQNKSFGMFLSSASYKEYDCAKKMFNTLAENYYSENMMKGKLVHASVYEDKKWDYILPGSASEAGYAVACGKQ